MKILKIIFVISLFAKITFSNLIAQSDKVLTFRNIKVQIKSIERYSSNDYHRVKNKFDATIDAIMDPGSDKSWIEVRIGDFHAEPYYETETISKPCFMSFKAGAVKTNSSGTYANFKLEASTIAFPGEYSMVISYQFHDGVIVLSTEKLSINLTINYVVVPGGVDFNYTPHLININFNGALYETAKDIDADGDIDVLGILDNAYKIAWLENNGSQDFTKHTIDTDFNGANSVYATDIDMDGDVDFVGSRTNEVLWWENDGSQNFTKQIIDSDFDGANSVYATDMDMDGDVDLMSTRTFLQNITTGELSGEVSWFENNGVEYFTKHTIDSDFDGANSVYATDVDSDGDIDVLGTREILMQGPILSAGEVSWWENDGKENFAKHVIDGDFDVAESVYATDIDGDGDMDILGVSWYSGGIAWWENDGSENFVKHWINEVWYASCAYATDIDGDSDVDVLGATNDEISWWENDGSENFIQHIIFSNCDGASSVYAIDIDIDEDIDFICSTYDPSGICWWENIKNEIGIHDINLTVSPEDFTLNQNYPNPFNSVTTIEYQLPKKSNVIIKVYNLIGQEIVTLVKKEEKFGHFKITWDGKDSSGMQVNSGLYIYRMICEYFNDSKKLIFLK